MQKPSIRQKVVYPSITFILDKLEWTEEDRSEFRHHPVYIPAPGVQLVTVNGYLRLLVQRPSGIYAARILPPSTPHLRPMNLADEAISSFILDDQDIQDMDGCEDIEELELTEGESNHGSEAEGENEDGDDSILQTFPNSMVTDQVAPSRETATEPNDDTSISGARSTTNNKTS